MNKELFSFIRAIGEPKRMLILNHLKKECCVGELWKRLGMAQNLTSHHLRVLKQAKLIKSEKRGLKVVYELNQENINKNLKILEGYLKK
ncbi:MAG: Transcriptional regulator, ArsR family [Parcubacteria group bacterium GW2011_GWE2_39_37]|uniref:Transcriptional regulator, ArsR family n=1 Tax=Candidatus Falkowbacteria bacterium GW2011_GWF2_39_8 TaxID=1618642 RepID=A0A0G0T5K9_9BACT|nr:MAG: Transcriptional regulator, ArsR family [Parcubacteria group bacterium GW2011_GWE2_39_37]KKR33097.1 MAG: Transcriptional regulator, ArsR family [Candidatus Falkowbacteria bacterium GW2011_GWF2_39_8]